jgi:hypothetical protein
VEAQIHFDRKENYFSFIKKYLRGEINGYDFRSKFLEMIDQDAKIASIIMQDFRQLEMFMLADNLEEFFSWLSQISFCCLEYYLTCDDTLVQISESKFCSLINNYYIQLKKVLPVISTNSLAYEKLISVSFKILTWILGLGITLIFFTISKINLIRF